MSIFRSTIAQFLRKTLDGIVDDTTDDMAGGMVARNFMKVESMDHAYEDYTSIGGPAYAAEKPEGVDVPIGDMSVGPMLRIFARTFGLRMLVSEEAIEDNKYKQVIRAAKYLKRAVYNTLNVDATSVLVRAWDTNYVGADSLPLFSSSHTLPGGGTYSNQLATPMSPSAQALIIVKSSIKKLPGLDGVVQQYLMPKKVICPTEQESVWEMILGSTLNPVPGNFAQINVVKRFGLELYANPFWDNTTTNWCVQTNAEDQILLKQRRKPRGRTWVNEAPGIMEFSCTDRHGLGWPDPRAMFGSQS